ncbi:MAG: DUF362 domain-containing protein [Desulfobacterales bacterium]|nr:DUF362 domain-containing protein [Desulfobacterales bacterium]
MGRFLVSIVRYEKPLESVRKAVELSCGFDHLPQKARVFIKPNIVFWTRAINFPKWGVITTSRVVEDIVVLLKERGIDDIVIGEGIVLVDPKDRITPAHAFETLGYDVLKRRYGVEYINVMDRPFEKVDLGDGVELKFNKDILHSDFVVDLPAMKAHNQTIVSLGIKNLKGTIDIPSRKKCHNSDPEKDLNFHVAKLADKMPPMFTLIDGIYSLEKGPGFDGWMRRSNILVGSADILSADLVGAGVLGHDPSEIPHLVNAARNHKRPCDLSDVEIVGEKIDDVASFHKYDFPYIVDEDRSLPEPLARDGIKGVYYRKFDLTMCTYCSGVNGHVLSAIRLAWEGRPWDKIEILTGKKMKPGKGMNKTILLGKCMYQAHKDNPDIKEMIAVKGCPPKSGDIVKALHKAGINVNPALFDNLDKAPGAFLGRYHGKPEFDESFHVIE